jgi:penicillin amidase
METGAFNWVSADATDISYRVHVSLPDRGNPAELPFTPNRVLPGANPRVVWPMDRFAPVTQFPRSRGGARGFLASANNDPLGFTQNGRTDDDPWYYGVWFDPGTRARRIETVLTQRTERAAMTMGGARVTAREMMDLQMDVRSVLADELVPVLEEALDRVATDPALAEFRGDAGLVALGAVVRGWDRRMARDSSGAVAYEGWQGFFAHRVLADDLGPVFDAVYGAESVYVLKMLVNALKGRHAMAERLFQEGRHRLALLALRDAQQWLTQRFGGAEPSRYRWRDLHRTEFRPLFSPPGVFDGGERETDGSVGTVNVSQAPFLAPGARAARMRHASGSGAVYRMVATFAADATPEAQINFVRGNSGDPTSRRWGDQVDSWVDGVYRPLAFRRADVVARSAAPEGERLVLSP